jgi:hypothetical protein
MKTVVMGSTKPQFILPLDEALGFSSHAAGVCYMKDTVEAIMAEDTERTQRRIDQTLGSGHHSVYGHVNYTFVFSDIPKALAMLLNNEGMYTTSEKSARYTTMKAMGDEGVVYRKWIDKLTPIIAEQFPKLTPLQVTKYAIENARYQLSVFTPTTMVYTTNLHQLNYLIHMLEDFHDANIDASTGKYDGGFGGKLASYIPEFLDTLQPFRVDELNARLKNRKLSMLHLHERKFTPYYGDVYCTTYKGSLAQYAQAQRHRTLNHSFYLDEDAEDYYVPEIVKPFEDEWRVDLNYRGALSYPQATMVDIVERGTYEHFILKTFERICCNAQREIAMQTADTFREYLNNSDEHSQIHLDYPKLQSGADLKSKVQIPNLKCAGTCNIFGRRYAINRPL